MKKLLIFLGIAATGAGILGVVKYNQVKRALERVVPGISALKNVNLNLFGNNAEFTLSVFIRNTTSTDIYINGVIFKITKIIFTDKTTGNVLGTAETNITKVSIPAFEKLIIDNITMNVGLTNTATYLLSSGGDTSKLLDSYNINVEVSALGYKFLI